MTCQRCGRPSQGTLCRDCERDERFESIARANLEAEETDGESGGESA